MRRPPEQTKAEAVSAARRRARRDVRRDPRTIRAGPARPKGLLGREPSGLVPRSRSPRERSLSGRSQVAARIGQGTRRIPYRITGAPRHVSAFYWFEDLTSPACRLIARFRSGGRCRLSEKVTTVRPSTRSTEPQPCAGVQPRSILGSLPHARTHRRPKPRPDTRRSRLPRSRWMRRRPQGWRSMIRWDARSLAVPAVLVLLSPPAADLQGQRLLEVEGIELRGSARVVEYGAGTCNVSEERETAASYEQKKANHGQPVDVWQLDFSVYNGSGRPLDHLIANYRVASENPPCTNWSWPHAGRYPGPIEWGDLAGFIQRSGSGNPTPPGETLSDTKYVFAFHDHAPRFDTWSVDYTFAAAAPAAGAENPPMPAGGADIRPRPGSERLDPADSPVGAAPRAADLPFAGAGETCAGKPVGSESRSHRLEGRGSTGLSVNDNNHGTWTAYDASGTVVRTMRFESGRRASGFEDVVVLESTSAGSLVGRRPEYPSLPDEYSVSLAWGARTVSEPTLRWG